MKTKLLFTFGVVVILITTIIFHSCKEDDPCEGINCLNGGACIDGECVCPEGYSGNYCEVEEPLSGELNFSVRLYNVLKETKGTTTSAPTVRIKVNGTSSMEDISYLCSYASYSWNLNSGDCPQYYSASCNLCGCWTTPCELERNFTFGNKGKPDGKLQAGTYTIQIIITDGNGNMLYDNTFNTIGGQTIRVEENETTQLARIDITVP